LSLLRVSPSNALAAPTDVRNLPTAQNLQLIRNAFNATLRHRDRKVFFPKSLAIHQRMCRSDGKPISSKVRCTGLCEALA
jgi:hypothetical protein